MTSLAEQLQQLAGPQTLIYTQEKHRPSLLFDRKEAANLDLDTIFAIGLSGYEELLLRNPQLKKFRREFFSESKSVIERALLGKEANDQLNVKISELLSNISPYFLLKSCHKALEWLIVRFHIHEYNIEDFLLCIFPYHETNMFVRAVQVIDFNDSASCWFWLKNLQTHGISLSKISLLRQCSSNLGILKFICKGVLKHIKIVNEVPSLVKPHLGLLVCSLLGMINNYTISEEQLSVILDVLLDGIASDCEDLVAVAYLILAALCYKIQLKGPTVNAFISRMFKNIHPKLYRELVSLTVAICQCQNLAMVKANVVKKLSTDSDLTTALITLSEHKQINAFVKAIVLRCLNSSDKMSENDWEAVLNIMKAITWKDEDVKDLLQVTVDCYKEKEDDETIRRLIVDVYSLFRKTNPRGYDESLGFLLDKLGGDDVRTILTDVGSSDHSEELTVQLHNVDSSVRQHAIVKLMESGHDNLTQYVRSALLDEDEVVVVACLKKLTHVWTSLSHNDVYLDLLKLLNRALHLSWNDVTKKIFIALKKVASGEEDYYLCFIKCLPLLMVKKKSVIKAAKALNKQLCRFVAPIWGAPQEEPDFNNMPLMDFSYQALCFWKKYFEAIPCDKKVTFFEWCLNDFKEEPFTVTFVLCNLCVAPHNNHDYGYRMFYCGKAFISHLLQSSGKVVCEGDSPGKDQNISLMRRRQVSLHFILTTCHELCLFTTCPDDLNSSTTAWTFESHPYIKVALFYFTTLMTLLPNNAAAAPVVLKSLKNFINRSHVDRLKLLGMFFSEEYSPELQYLQLLMLQASKDIISDSDVPTILSIQSFVFPSLLISVYNEEKAIRTAGLDLLNYINKAVGSLTSPYLSLVRDLLDHKEEIVVDRKILLTVVTDFLKSKTTQSKDIVTTFTSLLVDKKMEKSWRLKLGSLLFGFQSNKMLQNRLGTMPLLINKETMSFEDSELVVQSVSHIKPTTVNVLHKEVIWSRVKSMLICEEAVLTRKSGEPVSPQEIILIQFTPEVFQAMSAELQHRFMTVLINILSSTQSAATASRISKTVKHYGVDSQMLTNILTEIINSDPKFSSQELERDDETLLINSEAWKKLMSFLQIISSKKKLRDTHVLVPELFSVLAKILKIHDQLSMEYVKQLLLNSILHCCEKLSDAKTLLPNFPIEIIVQTVRLSTNPQTHQQALIVLTWAAKYYPIEVLKNIMSIFTFMGSSILRQDNTYTFQIIFKTIETVLPSVIKAQNLDDQRTDEVIASVFKIFITALSDIPQHRRLPLFTHLLDTFSAEKYLWLFLVNLCFVNVQNRHKKDDLEPDKLPISWDLEFGTSLILKYQPLLVMRSFQAMLKCLVDLPINKGDQTVKNRRAVSRVQKMKKTPSPSSLIDLASLSDKDYRMFQYTCLTFLINILTSRSFMEQCDKVKHSEASEPVFLQLVEMTLQLIMKATSASLSNPNKLIVKFWKAMLSKCHELLEKVNSLLTNKAFLAVFYKLIDHNILSIRHKSLEILNARLMTKSDTLDRQELSSLTKFIPILVDICKKDFRAARGGGDNQQTNRLHVNIQTALFSLKLLIRLFGESCKRNVVPLFKVLFDILKCHNPCLQSTAFLCLAESVSCVQEMAIPHLPTFMEISIDLLSQKDNLMENDILALSMSIALLKTVETVPNFLSPYLKDIVTRVCNLLTVFEKDKKHGQAVIRLKQVSHNIATRIPSRVLLSELTSCFTHVKETNLDAVPSLMEIFLIHFTNTPKDNYVNQINILIDFFLMALNIREEKTGLLKTSEINSIESSVVDVLTCFVLKLSESSFRPFFFRLFEWATRTEGKKERVMTFYRITEKLGEKLKGLFVLFAGHFLKHAAEALDLNNSSKQTIEYFYGSQDGEEKSCVLVNCILGTFHKIFLFDSENFINKDRFDMVLQPIVDQLENECGNEDECAKRVENVTLCVSQLALTLADDTYWKAINYQVLLKTRQNSPKVRLSTLKVMFSLTTSLGEDGISLLPETLPFLSELLEDEDAEVERECQKLIQHMEQVLGEPLQKYF